MQAVQSIVLVQFLTEKEDFFSLAGEYVFQTSNCCQKNTEERKSH